MIVDIETSIGVISVELYTQHAPKTCRNFFELSRIGYYDGTVFHRVIAGFMVQGGGFTPDMKQKSNRGNITNESSNGLKNQKGTIAMARLPQPHTASSQFFINCKDNSFLNKAEAGDGHGYCVFGKVTEGIDVLENIEKVATGNKGGHGDVPTQPVIIESASREA